MRRIHRLWAVTATVSRRVVFKRLGEGLSKRTLPQACGRWSIAGDVTCGGQG